MWVYFVGAAVLLPVLVALLLGAQRKRQGHLFGVMSPRIEDWPAFIEIAQLQTGCHLVVGGHVYVIEEFVRLGLTNAAPSYMYTLRGHARAWLFVQTSPHQKMAWLLEEFPWGREPVPTAETPDVYFGLGVYSDSVWRDVGYYPQDSVHADGRATYAHYFQDASRSLEPVRARGGLLSFEWRNGELTVRHGYPVDLAEVKVQ